MFRFRFVFVIFCLTAVMVLAVYLRSVNNRIFYEISKCRAEHARLMQELGTKQLLLEKLINPSVISHSISEPNENS